VRKRFGLILLALLIQLVVACQPAISEAQAIDLAKAAAGSDGSVERAQRGRLGQFVDDSTLPEVSRDQEVWAVVLSGNFEGECVVGADGQSHCPSGASTVLVVLDGQTGSFLLTENPAPPSMVTKQP
jgi:hypothetical protein